MPKGCREKRIGLVLDPNVLCQYGCNEQAHYQFSGGKVCCCQNAKQCPAMIKQCSESSKQNYRENPNRAKNHSETLKRKYRKGKLIPWSEGLTKETHLSIKRQSEKLKGLSTWNKGLTKDTDERVAAYGINGRKDRIIVNCDQCGKELKRLPKHVSETNFCDGECYSTWQHTGRKGEANPGWKPRLVIKCDQCGRPIERLPKKVKETNFCDRNCQNEYHSERMSGEGNSQYIDGTSSEPYGPEFSEELREGIRDRDGRRCVRCGMPEIDNGRRLDVHHIDRDKKNNDESNLVSLCKDDHSRVHGKEREWWMAFYQKMMRGEKLKVSR